MALKIGIIGAGNVGGALGRVWADKEHKITFGRRESNAEAVAGAEVVVLCVPWPLASGALRTTGDLAGKILIDCNNPLTDDLQ
jgi:predicted dinucleotide-binding enzyme